MLAAIDCGQRMTNARERMPRAFDDAFDAVVGDERANVIQDASRPNFHGLAERGRRKTLLGPADAVERSSGARHIDVHDAYDMHPLDPLGLRQNHRAEFSRPDDANSYRSCS